jgi:hypothetical protein
VSYDAALNSSLQDVRIPSKSANPLNTAGGSLEQPVSAPAAKKVLAQDGSIAPQTEAKKPEVKNLDVKGSSVEDLKK